MKYFSKNTCCVGVCSPTTPELHNNMAFIYTRFIFKGATSRGFCGFLAQTILELVVANLSHSEQLITFEHPKEDCHLNSQRENKPRPLMSTF